MSKLLSSSLDFLVLTKNKLQNLLCFRDDFVILRIVGLFQKTEPMEGIEPTTPRLQITCSSQLSYIGETLKTLSRFVRDCKDRYYF